MKRLFLLCSLSAIVLASVACNSLVAPAPTAAPAATSTLAPVISSPTVEVPAAPTAKALPTPTPETLPTPTAEPPSAPTVAPVSGAAVSFDRLSLTLPTGLASGASGTQVAEANGQDAEPFGLAPAHIELKLEGYALQGKFHKPQIYVYPADAYAQVNPAATQSLERVRAILAGGSSAPLTTRDLPFVPFFNATQVFAANVKVVPFQNGKGVRELTEYAQYSAPVNNHELIYQFQGLTGDGKYYVIAILPVTAPGLPEDAQPNAAVPAGGVALPDLNSSNPDWPGYYGQVQRNLESLQPGAFTPTLDQLDGFIGSLTISTSN
jgi:hypothetical protein